VIKPSIGRPLGVYLAVASQLSFHHSTCFVRLCCIAQVSYTVGGFCGSSGEIPMVAATSGYIGSPDASTSFVTKSSGQPALFVG
jgi:hypothetical protein